MNKSEAKRLLPMTVVMWDDDADDLGTVIETEETGFFVTWENGQSGWIAYQDAAEISLYYPDVTTEYDL